MNSRYKRGWFGESHRHYLAAKGVKTNRYMRSKVSEMASMRISDSVRETGDDLAKNLSAAENMRQVGGKLGFKSDELEKEIEEMEGKLNSLGEVGQVTNKRELREEFKGPDMREKMLVMGEDGIRLQDKDMSAKEFSEYQIDKLENDMEILERDLSKTMELKLKYDLADPEERKEMESKIFVSQLPDGRTGQFDIQSVDNQLHDVGSALEALQEVKEAQQGISTNVAGTITRGAFDDKMRKSEIQDELLSFESSSRKNKFGRAKPEVSLHRLPLNRIDVIQAEGGVVLKQKGSASNMHALGNDELKTALKMERQGGNKDSGAVKYYRVADGRSVSSTQLQAIRAQLPGYLEGL